jgi:hypothetical protein
MANWIFLPPDSSQPEPEPVKTGEKWVKHVHCDGARFHVISWSAQGTRCSCANCIINKPKEASDANPRA